MSDHASKYSLFAMLSDGVNCSSADAWASSSGQMFEVLLVFSDSSIIYISAPLHNVMMVLCLERSLRAFRIASGVTLL